MVNRRVVVGARMGLGAAMAAALLEPARPSNGSDRPDLIGGMRRTAQVRLAPAHDASVDDERLLNAAEPHFSNIHHQVSNEQLRQLILGFNPNLKADQLPDEMLDRFPQDKRQTLAANAERAKALMAEQLAITERRRKHAEEQAEILRLGGIRRMEMLKQAEAKRERRRRAAAKRVHGS